jgi:hypothetical protein
MEIWLPSTFGIRWERFAARLGRFNSRKDPRFTLDGMCVPHYRCRDIAEESNSIHR